MKNLTISTEAHTDYWVGGIDISGSNSWTWVDGENIPGGVPFWLTGSPNHPSVETRYCAYMSRENR